MKRPRFVVWAGCGQILVCDAFNLYSVVGRWAGGNSNRTLEEARPQAEAFAARLNERYGC